MRCSVCGKNTKYHVVKTWKIQSQSHRTLDKRWNDYTRDGVVVTVKAAKCDMIRLAQDVLLGLTLQGMGARIKEVKSK
jgi:hypothetical protein